MSVKEAAAFLGVDERAIKDSLIQGRLKGKKRSVGWREKWFVYKSSLEKFSSSATAASAERPGPQSDSGQEYKQFEPTEEQSEGFAIKENEAKAAPPRQGDEHEEQLRSFETGLAQGARILNFEPHGAEYAHIFNELEGQNEQIFWDLTEEAEAEIEQPDDFEREVHNHADSARDAVLHWLERERSKLELIVEAATKPFIEKLERNARELRDKDYLLQQRERELAEKEEQLRLLPDLQRSKAELERRVEAERQAAEILFIESSDLKTRLMQAENDNNALNMYREKERELHEERIAELQDELRAARDRHLSDAIQMQNEMAVLNQKLKELHSMSWWKRLFHTCSFRE